MDDNLKGVEPILASDGFWEAAFEPDDPFREELLREFRRGVVFGDSSDLAWGRMGLYSLSDSGLWPVVTRMIHLATVDPAAEFVESLAFFLSQPETLERMRVVLKPVSPDAKENGMRGARELQRKLLARGDADLGERLEPFVQLLDAH